MSVLDLPMQENDSGTNTIRGYFKALLKELISEGEGFSGKRPFGNSGWEDDLRLPLVKSKQIKGKLYAEDGREHLESCDEAKAYKVLLKAIEEL